MTKGKIGIVEYVLALEMIIISSVLVNRMFGYELIKSITAFIIYMTLSHSISVSIKKANSADVDYNEWNSKRLLSELSFMSLMTLTICTLVYRISIIAKMNINKVFILSIMLMINVLITLKLVTYRNELKVVKQEN